MIAKWAQEDVETLDNLLNNNNNNNNNNIVIIAPVPLAARSKA